MERDLISIIVPVYNTSKYLYQCVESIINQTYRNLEIILVDDGSTDDSGEICDKYAIMDDRIKVLHQKNAGESNARNNGLKVVSGLYVGFVDSDDWIDKEMYSVLYDMIVSNNADISTIGINKTNKSYDSIMCKVRLYNFDEYIKKFFKIGSQEIIYNVCNKLFKKDIIPAEPFLEGAKIGGDVVGTFNMILNTKLIVTNNSYKLYNYRQGSGITSEFSDKYFQLIEVWDKVYSICKNECSEYIEYADINVKRIRFTILSEIAVTGSYKKYKEKADVILSELKLYLKDLLKADIALSRKLLIIWFCVNFSSADYMLSRICKKVQ